jgi:hypothetical protein
MTLEVSQKYIKMHQFKEFENYLIIPPIDYEFSQPVTPSPVTPSQPPNKKQRKN